jgi:hypothetical protein
MSGTPGTREAANKKEQDGRTSALGVLGEEHPEPGCREIQPRLASSPAWPAWPACAA